MIKGVTAARVAAALMFACVPANASQASPTSGETSSDAKAAPAPIELELQEAAAVEHLKTKVVSDQPVSETARFFEKEVKCLAEAIYHEARGEPEQGQLAVGQVILNRVDSRYYPDTICDVVYQNAHMLNRCQFSFACDGTQKKIRETEIWTHIHARARDLVGCDDACRADPQWSGSLWTSTHYHADYVDPSWSKMLRRTGRIGQHIFYFASAT